MQFDKKELKVAKDCTSVEVTLKHTGKLPAASMGHNWTLVKTADVNGVANDGLSAGLPADYIKAGDKRVIAHTKVVGGGQTDERHVPDVEAEGGRVVQLHLHVPRPQRAHEGHARHRLRNRRVFMESQTADLIAHLLELEQLEVNLFRGESRDIGSAQVFGGQVLGQALTAASRTVEGRIVHSLHAYFLRRGDFNAPIVYEVDRSRDGHSFSNRRVIAIQHGEQIFNMTASFQVVEEGLEHQIEMPKVPPPEELPDMVEVLRPLLPKLPERVQRFVEQPRPFEFRMVQAVNPLEPRQARAAAAGVVSLVRAVLPDDESLHRGCSPTCRTSTCSTPRRCRMACRSSARRSSWRASTTPCGFTARCAWTTGCCTRSTARAPPARAASAAAACSRATAGSWPARRRKGSSASSAPEGAVRARRACTWLARLALALAVHRCPGHAARSVCAGCRAASAPTC